MFYEKNIKNGFTLNEVLVVIIILAAISAFAIPRYTLSLEKTRVGEGFQILESLLKAQKSFQFESGGYATLIDQLDVEFNTTGNFGTIGDANVDSNVNSLASITRTGGLYTLSIDEDGVITCTDGTVNCTSIGCKGAGNICN